MISTTNPPTNPEGEELITLAEVAKLYPKRPSSNAIWRHCRFGILSRSGTRIKLWHVRVGGRIYTRASALREFFEALAKSDAEHFDTPKAEAFDSSTKRSQSQRDRDVAEVRSDLAEAGVL